MPTTLDEFNTLKNDFASLFTLLSRKDQYFMIEIGSDVMVMRTSDEVMEFLNTQQDYETYQGTFSLTSSEYPDVKIFIGVHNKKAGSGAKRGGFYSAYRLDETDVIPQKIHQWLEYIQIVGKVYKDEKLLPCLIYSIWKASECAGLGIPIERITSVVVSVEDNGVVSKNGLPHVAKELGIKKVPVHDYRKRDGGAIVKRALMVISKKA